MYLGYLFPSGLVPIISGRADGSSRPRPSSGAAAPQNRHDQPLERPLVRHACEATPPSDAALPGIPLSALAHLALLESEGRRTVPRALFWDMPDAGPGPASAPVLAPNSLPGQSGQVAPNRPKVAHSRNSATIGDL